MAKQPGFILYGDLSDSIEMLTDADAGMLFKAIFRYFNNGEVSELPPVAMMAFMFIKSRIDTDADKYEETCRKRSEAGKKHKGNQYTGTNGTSVPKVEQMEQDGTNGTNQTKLNQTKLNQTKLNNNNIGEITPKTKRFVKPTIDEIAAYCNERNNGIVAETFFNFYESKGWVVGKSPMKDWKAAVRTWERSSDNKPKPIHKELGKDELPF